MKTRSHYPLTTNHYPLALSFLLPFVILGTIFALYGVYPFGSKQIIKLDYWHQHYPFLISLWHNVREGSISSWSWTAGLGHDYTTLFAYYMSSPLNFLTLIFPHTWLPEVLTFIFLLKIGCAGFFTGIFLHHIFKPFPENKYSWITLAVFPTLYALCAFTLGYFWSLNSFDSFALLPLVILGVYKIINEGKWKLYTISLSLALLANFYYSFFVCILAAIIFFGQCIIQKLRLREFLHKFGLIAAFSCLAICMTAVLLLPSWSALQNTAGIEDTFTKKPEFIASFFDVLGNFIAFTPPTTLEGLPNLYCGILSIMLAGLFFYSKNISRREKFVFGGILLFLILSCNINILNYLMHGFHITRGVPFRFSFLISLVLIVIAYRAFLFIDKLNRKELVVIGVCGALILLMATLGDQETGYVLGSAVFCFLYFLIFSSFLNKKNVKAKKLTFALLLVLVLSEVSVNSWLAIDNFKLIEREPYTKGYNNIQELLDVRSSAGQGFYRTEMEKWKTLNDPYFYNYNGISFFSSTVNANVIKYILGLGLSGNILYNNFLYNETSPLTNTLLNLRYLICPPSKYTILGINWNFVDKSGDFILLENKYYLPLGFMVKEEIIDYQHDNENPFKSQNDLFSNATGLKGDLFTIYDFDKKEIMASEDGMEKWSIEIQTKGMYYAYYRTYKDTMLGITANGVTINVDHIPSFYSYISPVGYFSEGDHVSFIAEEDTLIIFSLFDTELFEQGYSLLEKQPLILTKFTNTEVCGTVTALEDGLLYTSIPADRNWSVYVNGVKSEIVLIDNAMAAVHLNRGTHQIEFRYFNTSLMVGFVVSLVSIAVFVALALRKKGIGNRE